MKKKWLLIFLLISVLLNLFLIYQSHDPQPDFRRKDDSRQSIILKEEHRQFVLHEMRIFMESVQEIQDGIISHDSVKIIQAGKKSGLEAKPPKALILSLPIGFMKLGKPTHQLFDAIADSADIRFRPELTQQQLHTLLTKCVACHSAYRFDSKKTEN